LDLVLRQADNSFYNKIKMPSFRHFFMQKAAFKKFPLLKPLAGPFCDGPARKADLMILSKAATRRNLLKIFILQDYQLVMR
jgi:hypothetical protein